MMMNSIITIDGPASSGKGTIAKKIAQHLGFHYLDSGAIYRAFGLWVEQNYPTVEPELQQVIKLIDVMKLSFINDKVMLNHHDVTETLREERIGMPASKYGAIAEVRQKLLQFQRDFATQPGLVTDGRDMGSVVFPNAQLKVFLTASAEQRALRRFQQLQLTNNNIKLNDVLQDILSRDEADSKRAVAPLSYDASFKVLDNTNLDVTQTIEQILFWLKSSV